MVRVYTKKFGTNLIKPVYNDMRRTNPVRIHPKNIGKI
jgi:hypothetical protein